MNSARITILSAAAILLHLAFRFGVHAGPGVSRLPLLVAGISIVTSVLLGEYLSGAVVVLMLSRAATRWRSTPCTAPLPYWLPWGRC